ncbi:LysR family transcriptional regulator [Pseudomonas sp. P66]|jgi:LysR family glycine cleavage system transcriptional activator|uniref:LysR family transcriptional regulator n=1 Tax=Pseudomonas arcuscaelestis TaxID=2710591 RepID=A0ABS2C5F0_9PSED|nr:LysR substrate-binding domain-containing protein [Pseudomonas arcuscaelestis]MBM3108463.1 LysR family transcriptional regulator [Pseudomonas arcuscaelestis]MBM3108998.1 LysR family transcriptional regulator [Pseudomonas arcuscaelestis]MBM5460568.1 LysR family transcriptional regulator [Pseudomonas arcuscaelestis]
MSRFSRHLPPLDTLIAFEAVVRTGSFTRAASELYLTQSAVSKQIKLLEEHLGAVLFERRARGIALTSAGEGFSAIVEPMLESLLNNVLRLKAGHSSRNVSVICTHAVAQYWLFPRLLRFNEQHPELTVNIHASNEIGESNIANYDFGILYGHGHWSSLKADKLFDEAIYPIASVKRLLPEVDSLEQLRTLPLIQLDASAWNCLDWQDWFSHQGLRYQAPVEAVTFNQVNLVFEAVLQGMGVGLGWEFMARERIEQGAIRQVSAYVVHTGQADYLVHDKQVSRSPAAQVFADWLLTLS